MVELYWPRRGRFRDLERDAIYDGKAAHDVPADAEEHYRSRGWTNPPEDGEAPNDAEESGTTQREELIGVIERGTVADISDLVGSGEYDDVLDDLEEIEADRKDRKGVHEAIEERRDDLEE